jgi:hypothetical protein
VSNHANAVTLLVKRRDYLAATKTVKEYLEIVDAIEALGGDEQEDPAAGDDLSAPTEYDVTGQQTDQPDQPKGDTQ